MAEEQQVVLTAAELAERMGITVEALMEQARNGGARPAAPQPNRAQRRAMKRGKR